MSMRFAPIGQIKFCCDKSKCHSRCCMGGTAGAPLGKGEADKIRSLLPVLELPQENRDACMEWTDDRYTPRVHGRCAFLAGEGASRHCVIQEAYNKGLTDFMKPVSCHLFPLRVSENGAVRFEWRDCCKPAIEKGWREDVPLLSFLKDAIVRRFGEEGSERLAKR